MLHKCLIPVALLALTGCNPADEDGAAQGGAGDGMAQAAAPTPPVPDTPPVPQPTEGVAREVTESSDIYEFDYSYPAAAAAIPALKAVLDRRLDEARKGIAGDAAQAKIDSETDGFPFHTYGSGTAWQVVTELPGWLSMSGSIYSYTGGAHPNSGSAALLWDKQAGVERKPLSLFTSAAAFEQAVQPMLCDQLDSQRAKKRGEPIVRDQDDWSSACIGVEGATVLLGSSNRQTFDRIGFIFDPYVAGPYVEGDYEVTLPVTPKVIAALRPEYRGSFSTGR